ncbi:unnamed protein product [Echinostoma caproni]|uniref:RRM domain-containing protein n=1 Tax=Echinostoma caproni TaxID=27848 RepID=A0A3P8LDP5_9TREM|nr:unnamed protein product [Echinostoma caproni]
MYLQWLPHGALTSDADEVNGGQNDKDHKPNSSSVREIQRSKQKRRLEHGTGYSVKLEDSTADAEAQFELITSLSTEDMATQTLVNRRRKLSEADVEDEADQDEQNDAGELLESTTSSIKSKGDKLKVRNYENKKARLRRQVSKIDAAETAVESESACDRSDTVTTELAPNKLKVEERKPNKPVLIVRNIPFQATQDELTELFRPVGGLLHVRLPQKAAGGHRGFGFVEFNTIDQAQAARETLGSDTHFLGRRLQIEFAKG